MKKNLFRVLSLSLALLLGSMTLSGCRSESGPQKESTSQTGTTQASTQAPTKQTEEEKADMNIAVMTGPTAIGLVKVMKDTDEGAAANNYHFKVYGEATEITTDLIKGELDAACVPCNLAAVLYNKTEGEIVVAAINTLGVLYIVETGDTIHQVSDLAGKTIYTTGQGTTPEYTLRYILSGNGIDPEVDVTIEFKSEAAEVVSALAEDPDAIAMLPQPYVTAAMNNNPELHIALDITEEWERIDQNSTVVTGVLVARKAWIEENPDAFDAFLAEYPLSAAYTNESVEAAAQLIEDYGIFKAAIAKKAIPYCNVTYIEGEEMKTLITGYLTVLYDQNPAAVGGKLPAEDFFYTAE